MINTQLKMDLEIKAVGTTKVMEKEVEVIAGGFGKDEKCILAKEVAELHGVETKYINQCINRELTRFNDNDLIDLKTGCSKELILEMGFTPAQYGNAKNIFLLSQRGYMKLVSMMDNGNDMKWQVMDSIVDKYFNMQETINQISKMDEVILATIKGESIPERAIACGELVELVKEEAIAEGKVIGIEEGITKAIDTHSTDYNSYSAEEFVKRLKVELRGSGFRYRGLNTASDLNKFLEFKGYGEFELVNKRLNFYPNDIFVELCHKNGYGEKRIMKGGKFRMSYSEKFIKVFTIERTHNEWLIFTGCSPEEVFCPF